MLPKITSPDKRFERVINGIIGELNALIAVRDGTVVLRPATGAGEGWMPRDAMSPDRWVLGFITAVNGADPDDPANVTYDVKFADTGVEEAALKPTLGRPSRDGIWKIHPASVGDPVELLRTFDDDGVAKVWLRVGTEIIAEGPCTGGGT